MEARPKCNTCNDHIVEKDYQLQCDDCSNFFHLLCIGLSKTNTGHILKIRKLVIWLCNECKGKRNLPPLPALPETEDDRASKILKDIEARLSKLENKFSDSNSRSLYCTDDRSETEKSICSTKSATRGSGKCTRASDSLYVESPKSHVVRSHPWQKPPLILPYSQIHSHGPGPNVWTQPMWYQPPQQLAFISPMRCNYSPPPLSPCRPPLSRGEPPLLGGTGGAGTGPGPFASLLYPMNNGRAPGVWIPPISPPIARPFWTDPRHAVAPSPDSWLQPVRPPMRPFTKPL